MSKPLALYTDRALPLYPGAGLPLHRLPTVIDLLALRVTWEHHSYGTLGFDSPRLRASVGRVFPPPDSGLPRLIGLTRWEYTGYETIERTSSAAFGQIVDIDRYFRLETVFVDPELGTQRTPWLRVRPEGGGILYAHGLERQHLTWYERNASAWFANQGVMVIGFNTAVVQQPLLKTVYPDLSMPEFDFYTRYDPPLPSQQEVLDLITAPAPLPSGLWRFEFDHGAASYNKGQWSGHPVSGVVNFDARLLQGVDEPLSAITSGLLTTRKYESLVHDLGEGEVEASTYAWDLPLDFGT